MQEAEEALLPQPYRLLDLEPAVVPPLSTKRLLDNVVLTTDTPGPLSLTFCFPKIRIICCRKPSPR